MSVPKVADFNKLPIKYLNGAPVFLGDVAHVTDSHQPANQRGALQRTAGHLPAGGQARRRFDADGRRCGQEQAARHPRHRAQRPERDAHVRPVAIRARRAARRGAGGRHRRGPGRGHGAAVPRIAAQHDHRHHLDSAVDPHRHRRPQAHRPDDQHDDAGRNRARGRDAGRRRHRRSRKHPSQSRDGQAAAGGDSRRRIANRHARPLSARSPSASSFFRSCC